MNEPRAVTPIVDQCIWWLCWVLIAVHVALITHNALQLNGRYSPDSTFYINAADNLLAGNGLARTAEVIDVLVDNETFPPVPMTQWAPLYPVLIALGGLWGLPTAATATALSAATLLAIAAAVYWFARRCTDRGTALLSTAIVLAFAPLSWAADYAWSETLGVTLLFVTLAFLVRPVTRYPVVNAGLTGIFCALAFAARYALLPIGLIGFLFILRGEKKLRVHCATAFVATCLLVAGPIMARNIILSGTIGGARPGSGRGTVLGGTAETAYALWTSFTGWGDWLHNLMLALPIAAITAYLARRLRRTALNGPTIGKPIGLIATWCALYLVFLIVAQWRVRVDPIDARLVLPATVALFTAAALASVAVVRFPPRVNLLCSLALVVILTLQPLQTAQNIRRVGAIPPYNFERVIKKSRTLTWLRQNASQNDLIIAENGLDYPLYLGLIPTAFYLQDSDRAEPSDWSLAADLLFMGDSPNRFSKIWLVVNTEHDSDSVMNAVRDGLTRRAGNIDANAVQLVGTLEDAHIFTLTSPVLAETSNP